MTLSGILFDLDGTLLDTAPDLLMATNYVLDYLGYPKQYLDAIRPLAGDGARAMLNAGMGGSLTDEEWLRLRPIFMDFYFGHAHEHTRLFPGAAEVLAQFNSLGRPWGIVTNKPTHLLEPILPRFPLLNSGLGIVCGDTLPVAKPHPEPLWYLIDKHGLSRENWVFVGDHLRDIQAGIRAGMRTLVASYGYIPKECNIYTWGADGYIDNINELIVPE